VVSMNCSECQLLIDDIGDLDRLPSDAARHVANCAACSRFGAELIALRVLLREPARVTAPADFDQELNRRLRAAKSSTPSRVAMPWSLRPQARLAAAAAFLLVCSVTLFVSRYATSTQPEAGSTAVVATNRPAAEPASAARPADADSSGFVGSDSNASSPVVTIAREGHTGRAVVRGRRAYQPAGSDDAMLLVTDDRGTRLVDVPSFLVGSETIVPADLGGAGDGSETVSF